MRLTVLAGGGRSTNILLNWLFDNGFKDVEAIVEKGVPRRVLLQNRRRKLGLWTTVGQVSFQILIAPLLQRMSKERAWEIMREHGLRDDAPTGVQMFRVESVNENQTLELLRLRRPDLILVNGTRIIHDRILKELECPVVNTHVGVTPFYRGVHGGYWALWNEDRENFGVTLHLVDEGVDTGPVLAQVHAVPTKQDNFATYPLLQQAASFPALKSLLSNIRVLGNAVAADTPYVRTSRQWYHPTFYQYVSGLFRGVK